MLAEVPSGLFVVVERLVSPIVDVLCVIEARHGYPGSPTLVRNDPIGTAHPLHRAAAMGIISTANNARVYLPLLLVADELLSLFHLSELAMISLSKHGWSVGALNWRHAMPELERLTAVASDILAIEATRWNPERAELVDGLLPTWQGTIAELVGTVDCLSR